jgi:hypothetical protein
MDNGGGAMKSNVGQYEKTLLVEFAQYYLPPLNLNLEFGCLEI